MLGHQRSIRAIAMEEDDQVLRLLSVLRLDCMVAQHNCPMFWNDIEDNRETDITSTTRSALARAALRHQ
jgi:hypothetical protein